MYPFLNEELADKIRTLTCNSWEKFLNPRFPLSKYAYTASTYNPSLRYSRDLALFKPGDIVRLRHQYLILSCSETPQCYDTLTPMQIVSVDYGYATLKTYDNRTLTISVDKIEHYRKEELMTTNDGIFDLVRNAAFMQKQYYIPKRILKSGDRTIVFWKDGTKTIVKRAEGEPDNTYSAFTAALAIKLFGNNSKLSRTIRNCTEEQIVKPKKEKA